MAVPKRLSGEAPHQNHPACRRAGTDSPSQIEEGS